MEGVLSRNQNCWGRKVQVARGQWRGLPQLRFCRLWVFKEKWEELHWNYRVVLNVVFCSALPSSLA